jgi:hypothetical protein
LTWALLVSSGGKKILVWAFAVSPAHIQSEQNPNNNKHPEYFENKETLSFRANLKRFVCMVIGRSDFIFISGRRLLS